MIELKEILEIHQVLIQKFGGLRGTSDEGLLESAIEWPFAGFGQLEFYPTPEEKAGAILWKVSSKTILLLMRGFKR